MSITIAITGLTDLTYRREMIDYTSKRCMQFRTTFTGQLDSGGRPVEDTYGPVDAHVRRIFVSTLIGLGKKEGPEPPDSSHDSKCWVFVSPSFPINIAGFCSRVDSDTTFLLSSPRTEH